MSLYYDRDGKEITFEELVAMRDEAYRRVGMTKKGNVSVSTVWLGLNHRFGPGKPVIFETMVFGGKFDMEMRRYETLEQAKLGHDKMVRIVFGKNKA